MVTSIMDCAQYLRGHKFYVECDHKALAPLYNNPLKGALYDRWLTLMQQFTFEIKYKCAREMSVADALSRITHEDEHNILHSSPEEDDAFFPYVQDNVGNSTQGKGIQFCDFLQNKTDVKANRATIVQLPAVHPGTSPTAQQQFKPQTQKGRCKRVRNNSQTNSYSDPYDADTEIDSHTSRVKYSVSTDSDCNVKYSIDTDRDCDNSHKDDKFMCTTDIDSTVTHVDNSNICELYSDDTASKDVSCSDSYNSANVLHTNSSDHSVDQDLPSQLKSLELFKKTQYTVNDLSALQAADEELSPLIQYIQQGTLPASQKQSRKLMLESSDYVLIDGVLLKSRHAKAKRTLTMTHFQIVLPDIMIKTIINLYHDSPLSGHSGIQDTLDR